MNLNKKGFTLVELLAVIVVLALLMVVSTSAIGTALTNAKKNTLVSEAKKVLKQHYEEQQSLFMLDNTYSPVDVPLTTEGDFAYTVKFNAYAQVTEYCVSIPKSKLVIKKTGITGENKVPEVNGADIKEDADYVACS